MNSKLKTGLKILLVIIIVSVITFLIIELRKFFILKDLKNKVSKYENSNNYRITSVATYEDGTTTKIDTYVKGNKKAMFVENKATSNGETKKMSIYTNEGVTNTYMEVGETKVALPNSEGALYMGITNFFNIENDWTLFWIGVTTQISSENLDGKEVYLIKNFTSPDVLYQEGKNEMYIEKETGLCLKNYTGGAQNQRSYEFDNVDDSIFVEPSMGEYKIESNNQ